MAQLAKNASKHIDLRAKPTIAAELDGILLFYSQKARTPSIPEVFRLAKACESCSVNLGGGSVASNLGIMALKRNRNGML